MTRRDFLATGATTTAALAPAATPQDARNVRIGIAGGRFGATFQWHLHPRCEVAAVCDIDEAALGRLAETYRCGNRYKDFREMLRQPGLDAVGVFTPAPLHAWMTIESLKAGKHVISAVPAGLSEDELGEILETVKSTGLRYMMAETSYYRPETITCRDWARERKFGTILYSESEYHHPGLSSLMFDSRGLPTWRHGFPPMLYPTHCTGFIVPVTGERLTAVTATGWGDGHEILRTNLYRNPFWNTTAFFQTSGGHSARVAVYWHVAAGGVERAAFYGDQASFIMARPEGSPNTAFRIEVAGKTVVDANGYREQDVKRHAFEQPLHFERLPEPMRVRTGHGNSHTFLSHEFVQAILEDRHPAVNIWESIAYTLPGVVAHQSALKDGERMKIRDYGRAEG
jgi:predicted dehydrogenase